MSNAQILSSISPLMPTREQVYKNLIPYKRQVELLRQYFMDVKNTLENNAKDLLSATFQSCKPVVKIMEFVLSKSPQIKDIRKVIQERILDAELEDIVDNMDALFKFVHDEQLGSSSEDSKSVQKLLRMFERSLKQLSSDVLTIDDIVSGFKDKLENVKLDVFVNGDLKQTLNPDGATHKKLFFDGTPFVISVEAVKPSVEQKKKSLFVDLSSSSNSEYPSKMYKSSTALMTQSVDSKLSRGCYMNPETRYVNVQSVQCRKKVPKNINFSCYVNAFLFAVCHMDENNPIVEELLKPRKFLMDACQNKSPVDQNHRLIWVPFIFFLYHRLINNKSVNEQEIEGVEFFRQIKGLPHNSGKSMWQILDASPSIYTNMNLALCYFRDFLVTCKLSHDPEERDWAYSQLMGEELWEQLKMILNMGDAYDVNYMDEIHEFRNKYKKQVLLDYIEQNREDIEEQMGIVDFFDDLDVDELDRIVRMHLEDYVSQNKDIILNKYIDYAYENRPDQKASKRKELDWEEDDLKTEKEEKLGYLVRIHLNDMIITSVDQYVREHPEEFVRKMNQQSMIQIIADPEKHFFLSSYGRAATLAGLKNKDVLIPEFVVDDGHNVFDLVSITMHIGMSTRSGHWVCYFKCNNDWYVADDSGSRLDYVGNEDQLLNHTVHGSSVIDNSSLFVYVRRP